MFKNSPCAYPVFFRTYSRLKSDGERENWQETCQRITDGITKLGKLTDDERQLLYTEALHLKSLPSGRWLWVGGTKWIENPKNFYGAYNCSSVNLTNFETFGLMMNLAMQGCGTGAILEDKYLTQLPEIVNKLEVNVVGTFGTSDHKLEDTTILRCDYTENGKPQCLYSICVGDSRQGWVDSYVALLNLASDKSLSKYECIYVKVDISSVREKGEKLKSFGGVANPTLLPTLYTKVADILNKATGRQLDSVECCLLIDEAALVIVAGNIRRSAGIRQFSSSDRTSYNIKANLWSVDDNGNWRIDPSKDALRMANHTRVFHKKPTKDECLEAVKSQYYSGEGAIQYAPEAIARANADMLNTPEKRKEFLKLYEVSINDARTYLASLMNPPENLDYRMNIYGLNPCGEIILEDNLCNLSEVHLSQIDPFDLPAQERAFKAASLWVAALLHHEFVDEKLKKSRQIDPIVGVGMTGVFDFFVKYFGVDWLLWWKAGRIDCWGKKEKGGYLSDDFRDTERRCLKTWQKYVTLTVTEYCMRHNLEIPTRCTTVKPSGTQSLLTNSSPGWHPPKSTYYIRRITYAKNDPVALACIDYGYNVVPSQSDKDEGGILLTNPYDPRCTEWLVEIPVAVPWYDLEGLEEIEVGKFSALAQFDFMMMIQKYYVGHNTSSTLEFSETEIPLLSDAIYQAIQNDEGYISAALLARFENYQTFPRLPFEPISKETYKQLSQEVMDRRNVISFEDALKRYDTTLMESTLVACDTDKCIVSSN